MKFIRYSVLEISQFQNLKNSANCPCKKLCQNSPVSQYERPRVVALASSACVDIITKIITELTRKDTLLHLKRAN